MISKKTRVILVTDGDKAAQAALERVAAALNLRCISASGGNPTPISGAEIVRLLKEVEHDPVLVMFDDRGKCGKSDGEQALEFVASHPSVEVLGAVAVASNTSGTDRVRTDICIDAARHVLTDKAVDKHGEPRKSGRTVLAGDTVGVLNNLNIPLIVGIGDIGKMENADNVAKGSPVTKRAIEEILRRSGANYGKK